MSEKKRCDEKDDCGDGSDESDCGRSEETFLSVDQNVFYTECFYRWMPPENGSVVFHRAYQFSLFLIAVV